MTFDIVLVGFGNVARRFVHLLHEQRGRLLRGHDFSARIVAVSTRRHGQVFANDGLDARKLAARVAAGESLDARKASLVQSHTYLRNFLPTL